MPTDRRAVRYRRLLADRIAVSFSLVLCVSGGALVTMAATGERSPAPSLSLTPVLTRGLSQPLYLTHAGDGSGRLFVVEQGGWIRVIRKGALLETAFLDVTDRVLAGGERGLLGLAFHPNYSRNGRLFVNYTRKPDGATVVAEYRRSDDPDRARDEERVLMIVPQPYANHNGGMVTFGPDGFLYIGRGDGGSAGDPQNRAQNRHDLLGKILRIDVDHGQPYGIPPDNPFAAREGRPEIFASGLRNPWRFSFDRLTGALWEADVGQWKWEEINVIQRGKNYGWRIMEGTHCYEPRTGCDTSGLTLPLMEYGHEGGRCSIIGGFVYRGKVHRLRGTYLYGDYCSGEIFGLNVDGPLGDGSPSPPHLLFKSGERISSFGEDQDGEVYVVGHGGTVSRVTVVEPPEVR